MHFLFVRQLGFTSCVWKVEMMKSGEGEWSVGAGIAKKSKSASHLFLNRKNVQSGEALYCPCTSSRCMYSFVVGCEIFCFHLLKVVF